MLRTLQQAVPVEILVRDLLKNALGPTRANDDYLSVEVNPREYGSLEAFKKDYTYYTLLRKWKGWKGVDPTQGALNAWLKAELQCYRTNKGLGNSYNGIPITAIVAAQDLIYRVLGPLDHCRIAELCRFGSGAAFSHKRGTTWAQKTITPCTSLNNIANLCRVAVYDDDLARFTGEMRHFRISDANRMCLVPKDAKAHRPIAAEPSLNGYVQQGIGRYLRGRLKLFGVDLDDQTVNQDRAAVALTCRLATIDLSSASDTLCSDLVRLLLPREWWEFLSNSRCLFTTYGGSRYYLEKFSSMGNAYTFELESLIFYALGRAVSTGVTTVYGDDIVCSQEDYEPVTQVLGSAGFLINHSKSFTEGSLFFESCGAQFFDNQVVTPVYQKDVCRTPHDYVHFHNRLIRGGVRLKLDALFDAADLVRTVAKSVFKKKCPGVGPVVEYDEYFIKPGYRWAQPYDDRVKITSAVVRTSVFSYRDDHYAQEIYLSRKLRLPGYLNPDPKGRVSDSLKAKLVIADKYHWRSSSSED